MTTFHIKTPEAMEALGARLAKACVTSSGGSVYLRGELGAGKTTLVRGFIHGLGFEGKVKSPTYTLVEPYEGSEANAYHFDLYRVSDPAELELLGGRDYFDGHGFCLVEWPENGEKWLPGPDLTVRINYSNMARNVEFEVGSERGRGWLSTLK